MSRPDSQSPNKRRTPDVSGQNKQNRRSSHRIKCGVKVNVKNLDTDDSVEVKCINISFRGLGVELYSFLGLKYIPQDNLELLIHLPKNFKPIRRVGKLVWFKKIYPFLFRGGIVFIPPRKSPSP